MLKHKLSQAVAYLLCACLAIQERYDLSGSEFSGGWLTGKLLDVSFAGALFFVAASLLAFLLPRVASVTALAASLLSFPLYSYFVAPGFFRWMFKGSEWSEPLRSFLVVDRWALENLLAIVLSIVISIYVLWSLRKKARLYNDSSAKAPTV